MTTAYEQRTSYEVLNCSCRWDTKPETAERRTDQTCRLHGDDAPQATCVVCDEEVPVALASWEEHDYRHVGWWCQRCRHECGFGFTIPETLHPWQRQFLSRTEPTIAYRLRQTGRVPRFWQGVLGVTTT